MRISDWSSDVCSSDLLETRPLGRRTDQADVGKAVFLQGLCGDAKIDGMAVGHDQQPGIVGQAGDFAFRRVGDLDLEERKRAVLGKSVSLRVVLGGRRIIKTKIKLSLTVTRECL